MEKQQNFNRRDRLIEIEEEMQKYWDETRPNEVERQENKKKYYVTFPYPYMNGKLHLGHAFSMSKSEIQARYKKLEGYNVLFPQAFHCTGMPIQAAANKLRNELDNGILQGGQKQSDILLAMDIDQSELNNFKDPNYWLSYFPPIGQSDLKRLGVAVDWRRSFITTDVNQYYDSFIRWQFQKLREKNYISFGKRASIVTPSDMQLCMDHDRSEGEGCMTQEYTLIKMQIINDKQINPQLNPSLQQLVDSDDQVYLVAATLRPETMYGQTNCFILPTGLYSVYRMKTNQIYVCSQRSANNMFYQDMMEGDQMDKLFDISGDQLLGIGLIAPLTSYDVVYSLPMMSISMDKGTGIVTSVPSDAPDDYAALRDLQNKEPLRQKYNLKDHMVLPYNPIEIIEIPSYGRLSAVTACEEFKVKSQNDKVQLAKAKDQVYLKGFYEGVLLIGECKGQKVQDAKTIIKDQLIKQGLAQVYYEPDGLVVSRNGESCVVSFIDQWFMNYADQEWKDKVNKHINDTNKFNCYFDNVQKSFEFSVGWLREWGCSRSAGLGTKLPWDEQFIIESLSDSTIYFAYYTVAHFLQSDLEGKQTGLLDIKSEQMTEKEWDYIFLNKDYEQTELKVEKDKLDQMRSEFEYWYPMDLRCSAKDLIKNHLSMSLFNHAAVFEEHQMPRGFFCNGYINVDDKKMSKSTGNFLTVQDTIRRYGADATRIALANAGDSLDDANFVRETADLAILRLYTLEQNYKELSSQINTFRSMDQSDLRLSFFDKVFINEMKVLIQNTRDAYKKMKYRDIMKNAFYEFVNIKEEYKINVKNQMAKECMIYYMIYQIMLIQPVAPHISEYLYKQHLKTVLIDNQSLNIIESVPEQIYELGFDNITKEPIDYSIIQQIEIVRNFTRNCRVTLDKLNSKKGKKSEDKKQYSTMIVVYTLEYNQWQKDVLTLLQESVDDNCKVIQDWKKILQSRNLKDITKKALQFGQFTLKEAEEKGKHVFQSSLSFSELDLYKMIQESIKKENNIQNVEYVTVHDERVQQKVYQTAVTNTYPGKAQVLFE